MTLVGAFPMQSDAELAQMVLWAAGIPYVIETGDALRAHQPDGARGARLLVDDRHADDARLILDHRPAPGKEQS
jgi:hypothetical protein